MKEGKGRKGNIPNSYASPNLVSFVKNPKHCSKLSYCFNSLPVQNACAVEQILVASLPWTYETVCGIETGVPLTADNCLDAMASKVSTAQGHQPVKVASYMEISPAGLKTFQVWIWMGRVVLMAGKRNWKLDGRSACILFFFDFTDDEMIAGGDRGRKEGRKEGKSTYRVDAEAMF